MPAEERERQPALMEIIEITLKVKIHSIIHSCLIDAELDEVVLRANRPLGLVHSNHLHVQPQRPPAARANWVL